MHILINSLILICILLLIQFSGLGILKLIGLSEWSSRLFIAPSLSLAFFGAIGAIFVIFGIALSAISIYIWMLFIFLLLVGFISEYKNRTLLKTYVILLPCLFTTLLLSIGYVMYGPFDFSGSPALDGWSYVSFAQYLDRFPRGTEGGLEPLYQYASHLSKTRFVASALLALSIPPFTYSIDAQMTVGPLLCISFYAYCLSLVYLIFLFYRGINYFIVCGILVVGGLGGWVSLAAQLNNYDNLLALSFPPIIYGVLQDNSLKRNQALILSSVMLSAALYIYPELFLFNFLIILAVYIEKYLTLKGEKANLLRINNNPWFYLTIFFISLLLTSPYLIEASSFFKQQLNMASQMGGRPGEGAIKELIKFDWQFTPLQLWRLPISRLGVIGAWLLTILFSIGLISAFFQRLYALVLYVLASIAVFTYMAVFKKYDYGAYKVILVSWWAIATISTLGILLIWRYLSGFKPIVGHVFAGMTIFMLTLLLMHWTGLSYQVIESYPRKDYKEEKSIFEGLKKINAPTLVNVTDPLMNAWMVYYLRNLEVKFLNFYGYMNQQHTAPLMIRNNSPKISEFEYELIERRARLLGHPIFETKNYALIKANEGLSKIGIQFSVPNGLETNNGIDFFWLNKQPAELTLTSPGNQVICLELETYAGPSADGIHPVELLIVSDQKTIVKTLLIGPKALTIGIPLKSGANKLLFKLQYEGKIIDNPNGDPRELLGFIKLIQWKLSPN